MNHLSRAEIVDALRDVLSVAQARRQQYQTKPLPLRGEAYTAQSMDVIGGLRDGQLVAVSATFVQEIVNFLGERRHQQELPTAPRIRAGAAI